MAFLACRLCAERAVGDAGAAGGFVSASFGWATTVCSCLADRLHVSDCDSDATAGDLAAAGRRGLLGVGGGWGSVCTSRGVFFGVGRVLAGGENRSAGFLARYG